MAVTSLSAICVVLLTTTATWGRRAGSHVTHVTQLPAACSRDVNVVTCDISKGFRFDKLATNLTLGGGVDFVELRPSTCSCKMISLTRRLSLSQILVMSTARCTVENLTKCGTRRFPQHPLLIAGLIVSLNDSSLSWVVRHQTLGLWHQAEEIVRRDTREAVYRGIVHEVRLAEKTMFSMEFQTLFGGDYHKYKLYMKKLHMKRKLKSKFKPTRKDSKLRKVLETKNPEIKLQHTDDTDRAKVIQRRVKLDNLDPPSEMELMQTLDAEMDALRRDQGVIRGGRLKRGMYTVDYFPMDKPPHSKGESASKLGNKFPQVKHLQINSMHRKIHDYNSSITDKTRKRLIQNSYHRRIVPNSYNKKITPNNYHMKLFPNMYHKIGIPASYHKRLIAKRSTNTTKSTKHPPKRLYVAPHRVYAGGDFYNLYDNLKVGRAMEQDQAMGKLEASLRETNPRRRPLMDLDILDLPPGIADVIGQQGGFSHHAAHSVKSSEPVIVVANAGVAGGQGVLTIAPDTPSISARDRYDHRVKSFIIFFVAIFGVLVVMASLLILAMKEKHSPNSLQPYPPVRRSKLLHKLLRKKNLDQQKREDEERQVIHTYPGVEAEEEWGFTWPKYIAENIGTSTGPGLAADVETRPATPPGATQEADTPSASTQGPVTPLLLSELKKKPTEHVSLGGRHVVVNLDD